MPVLRIALLMGLMIAPEARADDWSLSRPRVRSGAAGKGRARAKPRHGEGESRGPGGRRGRQERMRERYLRAALSDPGSELAVQKLVESHRKQDGNLEGLLAVLGEQVGAEQKDGRVAWLRGRVLVMAGQQQAARESFQASLRQAPTRSGPRVSWAALERVVGDQEAARRLLAEALERTRGGQSRSALRRELANLALEVDDFEAAKRHFDAVSAAARGSLYLASEYARALAERGHLQRAIAEYGAVLKRLRGDNRVLPPLLVELAQVQLQSELHEAALATLRRATAIAPPRSGVRHEIRELMLQAHRQVGSLGQLVAELEKSGGRDPETLEMLGRIHDEQGDPQRALQAYRRALVRAPRDAETRLRVIRLLSHDGRMDEVIQEYRELVRRHPREARFLIALAELLMETGRRPEAMSLLARTVRANPRDASIQRALYELYSRWRQDKQAMQALKALVRIEPRDPNHLVVLGEHQMERGDRKAALATWRRIPAVASERAQGHATLGDLYLQHDMGEEALTQYERAVRLDSERSAYRRGLAEALQRARKYEAAIAQWELLLRSPDTDAVGRREARRRMVRIWADTGVLPRKVRETEAVFLGKRAGAARGKGAPAQVELPDLDAGRLLAEAYEQMGRVRRNGRSDRRQLDAAERVLRKILKAEPGDVASLTALERLLSARGDVEGAIQVLERLAKADPRRARSYLARMAKHAMTLYRDEDALSYAERSVRLNPGDAEAHRRLGELYRARQDTTRAIDSYRRAVELDPRKHSVHFVLAELYLSTGNPQAADRLLLQVMRSATDDSMVRRAARESMRIHLGSGTLAKLEAELLPLALGHLQRPVYRRMIVELYDVHVRPLGRASALGDERAREELAAIGRRGLKPLLEALADSDPNQRRIAVEVMGLLDNPAAAPPLLAFVDGGSDTLLRRQALLAAARVAGPELAARFVTIANAPERRLRDVAAWALARHPEPSLVPALRQLSTQSAPAVRGYAIVALGRVGDLGSLERIEEALRVDRSLWVRGAAALALGYLSGDAPNPALAGVLRTERGVLAAAAALGLGLCHGQAGVQALADALFMEQPMVQRAALRSLTALAADSRLQLPGLPPPRGEGTSLLALVEAALKQGDPIGAGDIHARFPDQIEQAARDALVGPVEQVRAALGRIAAPEAAPQGGLALAGALQDELVRLLAHPDVTIRVRTVSLLGRQPAPEAQRAVVSALADDAEAVRSAALQLLRPVPGSSPDALAAQVARIARRDGAWWMRRRGVEALGRLGGERARVLVLESLAQDPYAYVREAAAATLVRWPGELTEAALLGALKDTEPGVRVAAARALSQLQSGPARRAQEGAPAGVKPPQTSDD